MTSSDASVSAPDETAATTWASVTSAAEQVGVSAGAVRNWAARNQIRSRTGRGPRGERLEVCVEDVADRAEIVVADGDRHPGTELQPLAEQVGALGALIHQAGQDVAEWRARAEVAEVKLGFLGDQLVAARELPEQLRGDLVAARGRIVELEQQVRTATRPLFGRRRPAGS